jgi:hypothetical protein
MCAPQVIAAVRPTVVMPTAEVIEALDNFVPSEDRTETLCRLYEVLDGFKEASDRSRAIPALFGVLERFPDADLGTPGPIVHALESIPGYEPALAESVRRQPCYYTVWMMNRILNVEDAAPARREWIQLLESAAHHPKASPGLADDVARFLAHQGAE